MASPAPAVDPAATIVDTPMPDAVASAPPAVAALPSMPTPNGAPTRRYLNEKVTGVLLEGMKELARNQPEDPLRVLGEFLIRRSREVGEISS